jgi:hypothetical protein
MELHDELSIARSQQEWANYVLDNAPFYIEKWEFDLVEKSREYVAALAACRFLGIPSPEAIKAWMTGSEFWKVFEAYRARRATVS